MKITLGKIDYNGIGKKNCRVSVDVNLQESKNGLVFTASGNIWNHIESDIYAGGQMLEEIKEYFPCNKRLARLVEIWKVYHLNDMQAGTPKQMKALKNVDIHSYGQECDYLKSKGLLFDGDYEYGTGWKYKSIPKSIVKEIQNFMSNGF